MRRESIANDEIEKLVADLEPDLLLIDMCWEAGQGLSIVLLSEQQASIRRIDYKSDYHRAQWLATQQALEERGCAVIAMTMRDLSLPCLKHLSEFFKEVARRLKEKKSPLPNKYRSKSWLPKRRSRSVLPELNCRRKRSARKGSGKNVLRLSMVSLIKL